MKTLSLNNVFKELQIIRNFRGEPSEFMQKYLAVLKMVSGAEAAISAVKHTENEVWQIASQIPEAGVHGYLEKAKEILDDLMSACLTRGHAIVTTSEYTLIAVLLIAENSDIKRISLFKYSKITDDIIPSIVQKILTLNDIYYHNVNKGMSVENSNTYSVTSQILEIIASIEKDKKFVSAVMTICNSIAMKYNCDMVSLGWLHKNRIRVVAMSHVDEFEKKKEIVQLLEGAMEEAFDQEYSLLLPSPVNDQMITLLNEEYKTHQLLKSTCAIPIVGTDGFVSVLFIESQSREFTEVEVTEIRSICESIVPNLSTIKFYDRWIGFIILDNIKRRLSSLLGFEHLWLKLVSGLAFVFLILALTVPLSYKVRSPMILKTDNIAYLTAPYEGYIDSVNVVVGDVVKKDQSLVTLDRKRMLLEESNLIAEKNRNKRELEKARAAKQLADMRIADAEYRQSIAKLKIVKYRLNHSSLKSLWDGIVIEGDLKKRIGAPVKDGETLLKIGKIDEIYVEVKVDEKSINFIEIGGGGVMALASRPDYKLPIAIEAITPTATSEDKENRFTVKARIEGDVPEWFRPGMTGIAKVYAGKKTAWWIVTHKVVDIIKMKLWW